MQQQLPLSTQLERQNQKAKLTASYHELIQEFGSKELRNVGNYTLGRLIGKGAFGKVYLAYHTLTNGTKVVLKSAQRDDHNLAREIHHHRQFIHPHIARLYEIIVTENLVWLVLEYCPGDELYNYLLHHGPLPIPKVQRIFTQLVGAVAYVHKKSCVHRDLKLENILLDKYGNVKLCDFGFTREYENKLNCLQTFCGTICYAAPEMLKGEKYSGEKVDVWSLGVILYALLVGELPFDEDHEVETKARILNDEPKFKENIPAEAKELIGKMLSKRPLHRPSLSDILDSEFLKENAQKQKDILNFEEPAPFSSRIEIDTLSRLRSAGVNTGLVMENVIARKCDALTGWWTIMIDKERRKEKRKLEKRISRDAETRNLRRLSAASTRLEKLAPLLNQVVEETSGSPSRSDVSRGRSRRGTPIASSPLLPLPESDSLAERVDQQRSMPETSTHRSPARPPLITTTQATEAGPPTPRPPPPPKDITVRKTRQNSAPKLSNPNLLGAPTVTPNGAISKRAPQKRNRNSIINQLSTIKHWLIDTTKRNKSPTTSQRPDLSSSQPSQSNRIPTPPSKASPEGQKSRHVFGMGSKSKENAPPPRAQGLRQTHTFASPASPEYLPPAKGPPQSKPVDSQPLILTKPNKSVGSAMPIRSRRRSSIASTSSLHSSRPSSRPGSRKVSNAGLPGQPIPQYPLSNGTAKPQISMTLPKSTPGNRRTSLSPSPLTPRSTNYRRHSGLSMVGSGTGGLRGRKSTSSSMSSIRSLHRSVSQGQAGGGSYAPSVQSGISQSRHSRQSSTSSRDRDSITSSVKTNSRSPRTGTPLGIGAGSGVKVLPATPTTGSFPSGLRFARRSPGPAALAGGNGGGSAWQPPEYTSLSGADQTSYAGGASGLGNGSADGGGGLMGPNGPPTPTSLIFAKRKKRPFKGPNLSSSSNNSSTYPASSAAGGLFAAHTLSLVGPNPNSASASTSTNASSNTFTSFGGLLMGSRKTPRSSGHGHGHGRSSSRGSNKAARQSGGEEAIIEEEEEELEGEEGEYEVVAEEEEDEEEGRELGLGVEMGMPGSEVEVPMIGDGEVVRGLRMA